MRATVLGALAFVACQIFGSQASAYHEPGSEWVRGSAYTLRSGELNLGILDWSVGVTDEVTVGTVPVLWAVGPWVGNPIPNAELKVRDWFHRELAISAAAGFLYLDGSRLARRLVSKDDAARLFVLHTQLASAWQIGSAASVGTAFDLTYAALRGRYEADKGNAVEDSMRLSAWGQWRFTRFVALRLNGRLLLYSKEPTGRVQFQASPSVMVDADVSFANVAPIGAWALSPQVELSGKHVNVMAGAGYGYLSVPLLDVMLDERGVFFTFDFFVRFGG